MPHIQIDTLKTAVPDDTPVAFVTGSGIRVHATPEVLAGASVRATAWLREVTMRRYLAETRAAVVPALEAADAC